MKGSMACRQRGMSFIGWLITLSIAVLLGLAVLRLVPVYLEYYKIASILESLRSEHSGKAFTVRDIRVAMSKRFDIDAVNVIETSDVKVERNGKGYVVRARYEHQTPYIGNVKFLISFDKSVEIAIGP